MLQNLKKELLRTRRDLTACLQETMPTKEFGDLISMAMVSLHMIEDRVCKTQNLHERRELIHEFNFGKETIEKGIRSLRKASKRRSSKERFRRAMP